MKIARLFTAALVGLLTGLSAGAQGWSWGVAPIFNAADPYFGGVNSGALATDATGNVFAGASTFNLNYCVFGTDIITPVHSSNSEGLITKVSPAGNFLWSVPMQSSSSYPMGLAANASGSVYVLGVYIFDSVCVIGPDTLKCAPVQTGEAYFLAKINTDGVVLWAKNMAVPLVAGSAVTPSLAGLVIDAAGNLYTVGSYSTPSVVIGTDTLMNANPAGGNSNFFVAKFDSSGDVIWASTYGGNLGDQGNAIAVTPAGDVYIAGSYYSASFAIGAATLTNTSGASGNNLFVAKFSTSGAPVWAQGVQCAADAATSVGGLAVDPQGNAYFAGGFAQTSINFGGTALPGNPVGSPFLVKYDTTGNVKWARTGSGEEAQAYGVTADNCGNVWTCGTLGGPGSTFSGHTLSPPVGSYIPAYIIEYDTAGNYLDGLVTQDGAGGAINIVTDELGDFYLSGDFNSDSTTPSHLTLGPDTLTVDSSYQNLFIGRYVYSGPGGCSLERTPTANSSSDDVVLFPNPATDECTFRNDATFPANTCVKICDADGRAVCVVYPLTGSSANVPVTDLPPGIYFCRIETNGKWVTTKKLVVMR